MTHDKIKKPTVGAVGGRMGSRDFVSLAVPILARKSIKRKVELLDAMRIQSFWLARTHVNPSVRRKHWAVYATCQRRIARLSLGLESGA